MKKPYLAKWICGPGRAARAGRQWLLLLPALLE
jgi:hypothetical protein